MKSQVRSSGAKNTFPVLPQLVDQEQLALILGVEVGTVMNWRRRKVLPPAVCIGRSVRWLASDVTDWILEHREVSA